MNVLGSHKCLIPLTSPLHIVFGHQRQRGRNTGVVLAGSAYKSSAYRKRPFYGQKNFKYKTWSKSEQEAMWRDLFSRPHDWWDARQEKQTRRSPDFKHREDSQKALWVYVFGTDIIKPEIQQQLQSMDSRKEVAERPLMLPSNDEVFRDVIKNPLDYIDLRRPEKTGRGPDFRHIETRAVLWLSSIPEFKHNLLEGLTFGSRDSDYIKPKISLGIDPPEEDPETEIGDERIENDVREEQSEKVSDEEADLDWSKEDNIKAVDALIGFTHDLAAESSPPEASLKVELLRYQRQGLAWMLKRETDPELRGGMLCDEQGLGKTIQAISLILANPQAPCRPVGDVTLMEHEKVSEEAHVASSDSVDADKVAAEHRGSWASSEAIDEEGRDLSHLSSENLPEVKATLVLMPNSVIKQWQQTIETQTDLKVLAYMGSLRESHQAPGSFAKYDVVLASYLIGLYDSPLKRGKALYSVKWRRIILDEMQVIKNHQSSTAAALALLQVATGGSRWLMSGTPFQNNPWDEMYSYLHFLQHAPYNDLHQFREIFPQTDKSRSLRRLAAFIRPFMLRRTKKTEIDGELILHLPQRLVTRHEIMRGAEETAMYAEIEAWVVQHVQDSMQKSQETEIGKETRSCILAMLTDLRRACDHPFLAKSFWNAQAQAADERESRGLPANRTLAYDTPMSAKIEEVVRLVRQHPDEKIIVFSTWTDMLDLIEEALMEASISFQRLDGDVEPKDRGAVVADMRDDPDCRVFLISLHAGKEGLNLQFCQRAVLVEPDYNPSAEEQAMDRCHRIGQTKDVHIHKFFIKDTVETQIFALQEYKLALAAKVLDSKESSKTDKGVFSNERLADLMSVMKQRSLETSQTQPLA